MAPPRAAAALLLLAASHPTPAASAEPTLADVWAAGSYQDFDGTLKVTSAGEVPPGYRPGRSQPPVQLVYLALRGLAELPRLMLEVSGTPYTGIYHGKSDLVAAKPDLPLGRVPVLLNFDGDGGVLAQSATIVRHLSTRTGLAGASPTQRSQVDMAYETVKELFSSSQFDIAAMKAGVEAGEKLRLHYRETSNRGDHSAWEKGGAALLTVEEMLAANFAASESP